jgi:hypothetical protein
MLPKTADRIHAAIKNLSLILFCMIISYVIDATTAFAVFKTVAAHGPVSGRGPSKMGGIQF